MSEFFHVLADPYADEEKWLPAALGLTLTPALPDSISNKLIIRRFAARVVDAAVLGSVMVPVYALMNWSSHIGFAHYYYYSLSDLVTISFWVSLVDSLTSSVSILWSWMLAAGIGSPHSTMLTLDPLTWLPVVWIGSHWLYRSSFESSRWQGTPGKLLCGLKISGRNGERLTFVDASVRHWCLFLTLISGVFVALFSAFQLNSLSNSWQNLCLSRVRLSPSADKKRMLELGNC